MSRLLSKLNIRVILFILSIITVCSLSYYLYKIVQEKRDFTKAESSIDALAQQIQNKIGKADQTKKDKSCDRTNQEVGKGQLHCTIAIYLLYANKSAAESTTILDSVSAFSSAKIRVGSPAASEQAVFTSVPIKPGDQTYYQDTPPGTISCTLGYQYPALDNPAFPVSYKEGLQINITCSKATRIQLYPMRN